VTVTVRPCKMQPSSAARNPANCQSKATHPHRKLIWNRAGTGKGQGRDWEGTGKGLGRDMNSLALLWMAKDGRLAA